MGDFAESGGNRHMSTCEIRNFWFAIIVLDEYKNKYVGPTYCRAKMYSGRVACCPLVSHGEYADGTDGRTPERYVTLSARRGSVIK